jgi:type IV pilus assembly protein PilC
LPLFNIEAMDPQGKRVRTQIDATNPQDAILKVKVRGYKPISVKPALDGAAAPAGSPHTSAPAMTPPAQPAAKEKKAAAPPIDPAAPIGLKPGGQKKGGWNVRIGGGVTHKQLTQFTHQFAVLMEAGLPVVRSLKILANQQKPGLLKDTISMVAEDVESGSTLSEAMGKHPKVFDKLYVNMVRAGEAGGVLEEIMRRLAQFMEKIESLRRKIIGASIYPVIVICIAVAVVLFIMTFIVPRFKDVFSQVGVGMPTMTLLLLSMSDFIKGYWYVILLAPVVGFILLRAWGKTKGGRLTIDRIKLKLPIVGMIIRKSVTARFCRTLGTLLKSGVPILEALNIVRNATGNEVVALAISKVHDNVREGESIARPLADSKVFDDLVINMIDVGEETGELDSMLLKIADIYDEEVDAAVGALVSILEPIMIVGLGATVGFIVVALFLPLVTLLKGLSSRKA